MLKFCKQCGAPLDTDRKFCEECGSPVTLEPSAPPKTSPEILAPVATSQQPPVSQVKVTLPDNNPGQKVGKEGISAPPSKPSWRIAVIAGIVILAIVLEGGMAFFMKLPLSPAVAKNDTQAEEWDKWGDEFRFKGDLANASDAYDRALALDPNNDNVWVNKGFLEERRENYQEAIFAFNKSIELAPSANQWLLFHIGTDLNRLKQYDEALKTWDKIFALNSLDQVNIAMPEVWNEKGRSLSGLGRYEEAVEAFDMAISLYPEHEFAWNSKGKALEELGRNSKAAAAYQKALNINPTYEEAKANLANLQAR